jgi:hypothetical protein
MKAFDMWNLQAQAELVVVLTLFSSRDSAHAIPGWALRLDGAAACRSLA